MTSPQRHFRSGSDAREYVDSRGTRRGPYFRHWWLRICIIIGFVSCYFGYPRTHYQSHSTTPAANHASYLSHKGSSAPAASHPDSSEHNIGARSRNVASETGNGQGQSIGRTAVQSTPRGNAEVGREGNHQTQHP